MKNFDDLFNEFFGEKKRINSLNDEIKKIIDSLANFKTQVNPDFEDPEQMIANHLNIDISEPTSTEEFIQDGIRYKKLTWDTPKGKLVKIVMSEFLGDVTPTRSPIKEKSLEEQLQEAVDNEDFELAIKLRDKINTKKK